MWNESRESKDVAHIRMSLIKLSLLYEKYIKKETSIWKPCIDALPKTLDEINLPMFWTSQQREWLKGTNIDGDCELKLIKWKKEYALLKEKLPDLDWELLSIEKYLWACSIFSSRAFPGRLIYCTEEEEKLYGAKEFYLSVLLPIVDIANHKPLTPVSWDTNPNQQGGGLAYSILYPVHAGCEVFNNYGPKGNEELLMGYGFTIDVHSPSMEMLAPFLDLVMVKLVLPKQYGIDAILQKNEIELEEDGSVVFKLTETIPLNLKLLLLFTILSILESLFENQYEDYVDFSGLEITKDTVTRVEKLNGMDCLIVALEKKLIDTTRFEGLVPTDPKDIESLDPVSQNRLHHSNIYRTGQVKILKKALEEAKKLRSSIMETAEICLSITHVLNGGRNGELTDSSTIIKELTKSSEDEDLETENKPKEQYLQPDEVDENFIMPVALSVEYLKGVEKSKYGKKLSKIWKSMDLENLSFDDEELIESYKPIAEMVVETAKNFNEASGNENDAKKIILSDKWTSQVLAEASKLMEKHSYCMNQEEYYFIVD